MQADTGRVYRLPDNPELREARPGDVVDIEMSAEERERLVDKHAMLLEHERGLRPARARRKAETLVPPVGATRFIAISEDVAKTIRRGEKATEAQRRKAKRAQAAKSRRRNR